MTIYSPTRLDTFRRCPRRYYYKYVRKVRVERDETIEAFMGKLVHGALERLYRARMHGRLLTAEELVGHFNAAWEDRLDGGIVVVRKDYTPDDYRRVGVECIRRYHRHHAPCDLGTTLALEDRISIALDGNGRYKMQGVIDRLAQADDGAYEIHDFKTNLRLPGQQEIDEDQQLALYEIGVRQRWPGVRRIRLVWHFLRHDQEMCSSRTDADLERLRGDTIRTIDDIESRDGEDAFETKESALCGWCPFQSVCPARRHLMQVSSLPPDRFDDEPGVVLVNRFADLQANIDGLQTQVASLEEEKQQVKDALTAYAEREGLEVVAGSDREARVTRQTRIVLPRKTQEHEQYERLDERLRRSEAWPSVSALDAAAIRRIWAGDDPDPGGVRETVKPFVREEDRTDVRLRQRREE